MWSETNQRLTQLAAELSGPGALRAGDPWAMSCCAPAATRSRAGTTEVLKNIVAERVLGLPKSR